MSAVKKFLCTILISLCAPLISSHAIAASDNDVVGMIVNLQGGGEVVAGDVNSKMQLLQYVKPKMQLKLDAGSKASVSHYQSKMIYQLTGPAVIEVDADGLKALSGNAPVSKSMAQKLVVAAADSNLMPAAVRMRDAIAPITIATTKNGSVLLKARPVFTWNAFEATSYDFKLEKKTGGEVLHSKVDAASMELPAGVNLEYGMTYKWSVSYVAAADGKINTVEGEFSVLPEADAQNMLSLKPAADAPIEEWILYASTLQNRHVFEEAHEIWRQIAVQRPDLKVVQNFAR
jgi:hypothetical protein